jgi:antitoxin component YwqK of YwqJK toxin-antitoxin module
MKKLMGNLLMAFRSKGITALLLLLPLALAAQKQKVYWLDQEYREVKKKKAVYSEFWSPVNPNSFLRTVRFMNGNLHIRAHYSRLHPEFVPDSFRQGSWESYNPQGQLLDSGYFQKGRKHGKWYERNSELPAYSLGQYRNGQAEGRWQDMYDNGNIRFKGAYVHGKNSGEHLYFSESGVLVKRRSYRNDTLDGPIQNYDEQGRLLYAVNYKNGQKHGRWVRYTESRQLFEYGTYDNGNRVGSWYFYHPNGKLASFEQFASADSGKGQERLLHVQHYNTEGKPVPFDSARAYTRASAKGGLQQYYSKITDLVEYPEAAREAGKGALVMVCFTITPEGRVDHLEICQMDGPRGYGFEAEVLRVMRLIDWQWEPAIAHNRPAYGSFRLPVKMSVSR